MLTEEQKTQLCSLIDNLDSEKHYWFFRTMSGSFFNEFLEYGFVAIGYDEILTKDLKDLPEKEYDARTLLKFRLESHYHDLTPAQTAKAAGQLLKFYREMKKGDVVVIPDYQSKQFAFGVVDSDMYEDVREHYEEWQCPFVKRRGIKWLKKVDRYQLDSRFLLGLGNQQTMSCIDDYSEFIDRKIKKLYTKGDKAYLILRVNQDKGLSWDDFCFISDLQRIVKGVTKELDADIDISQVEMKINVQSPGDIVMSCMSSAWWVLALVALVIGLAGGEIGGKFFIIKTNGIGNLMNQLADAWNKFKNGQVDRDYKKVQIRLANMKIEGISDSNESQSLDKSPCSSSLPSLEDDNEQNESPKE